VEKALDRNIEDFELKVMSAGADAPFRNDRQYRKNIGKKVRLITHEEKKFEGTLIDFDGEKIILEIDPKLKKGQKPGKNRPVEERVFPLTNVKETKRIVTF
ncbi:MAG: ribosome assembly cofactor RimP, partial [Bacteroidales bacterium]|nr:ribosome assembly cofactor RimP [Bacteroidales bacterium]